MPQNFKKILNRLADTALYELQDQVIKKDLGDLTKDNTKQPYELIYTIGREDELTGGDSDEYESGLDEDDTSFDDDDDDEDDEFNISFDDEGDEYDYIESDEDDMLDAIRNSVEDDNDIVIELDDGSEIYLSNSAALKLLGANLSDDFYDSLTDIDTFMAYISALNLDDISDDITEAKAPSKHNRKVGRVKILNRVRAGKVQIRKRRSAVKGYKISGNSVVKMDPREVRKRKIGARIGKRKRRAKAGIANRRRAISNRIRKNRLKG